MLTLKHLPLELSGKEVGLVQPESKYDAKAY